MEMPVSELFDRCTILQLKKERFEDEEKKEKAAELFDKYDAECRELEKANPGLLRLRENVYECNATLWDLEGEMTLLIRDGAEHVLIANKAIAIRGANVRRVAAKNSIADLLESDYRDDRGSTYQ